MKSDGAGLFARLYWTDDYLSYKGDVLTASAESERHVLALISFGPRFGPIAGQRRTWLSAQYRDTDSAIRDGAPQRQIMCKTQLGARRRHTDTVPGNALSRWWQRSTRRSTLRI